MILDYGLWARFAAASNPISSHYLKLTVTTLVRHPVRVKLQCGCILGSSSRHRHECSVDHTVSASSPTSFCRFKHLTASCHNGLRTWIHCIVLGAESSWLSLTAAFWFGYCTQKKSRMDSFLCAEGHPSKQCLVELGWASIKKSGFALSWTGFPLLLSSAYSRGQQSFVLSASLVSSDGGEYNAPVFAPSAVH